MYEYVLPYTFVCLSDLAYTYVQTDRQTCWQTTDTWPEVIVWVKFGCLIEAEAAAFMLTRRVS